MALLFPRPSFDEAVLRDAYSRIVNMMRVCMQDYSVKSLHVRSDLNGASQWVLHFRPTEGPVEPGCIIGIKSVMQEQFAEELKLRTMHVQLDYDELCLPQKYYALVFVPTIVSNLSSPTAQTSPRELHPENDIDNLVRASIARELARLRI